MESRLHDVIIIGAGISGLACARTLQDNNKKFIIISEDIGGRIVMSGDSNVAYGAYFIGADYKYVSDYAERKQRIGIFNFKSNKKEWLFFIEHPFRCMIQALRLIFIILKFKKHYHQMKKRCINISQKKAIREDEYLYGLYNKKAINFIKEKEVYDIIDKYIEKLSYSILFSGVKELNTFEFLRWILYLMIPIYEFRFLKDKIIEGFKDKIIIDSVVFIKKEKEDYKIRTRKGKAWRAKNVVVATPIHISQKLLNIKKIKEPATAHMFHLNGEVKENFIGVKFFTSYEDDGVFGVALQSDGTYLFYCDHPKPKFNKYFKKYKIIAKKFWNPAFNIRGNELLECEWDKNLYLIGDYNICGMEDSFITGIYAANRIIERSIQAI